MLFAPFTRLCMRDAMYDEIRQQFLFCFCFYYFPCDILDLPFNSVKFTIIIIFSCLWLSGWLIRQISYFFYRMLFREPSLTRRALVEGACVRTERVCVVFVIFLACTWRYVCVEARA